MLVYLFTLRLVFFSNFLTSGKDVLVGGSGADEVNGGAGSDIIYACSGDVLTTQGVQTNDNIVFC